MHKLCSYIRYIIYYNIIHIYNVLKQMANEHISFQPTSQRNVN